MSKTPWGLMFTGHHDEAVRLMRDAYLQRTAIPETLGLGIAYLWLGDYVAAWEHFSRANQRDPGYSASYYNMAGMAKWCLGDRSIAVEQWLQGCDCEYADGAGGVESPLLLFAASIIAPGTFARSEAEKLLTVRANESRVQNWPGPVAEFALRRIDESGLRKKCVGFNPRDTTGRHWEADFYVGVVQRAAGNVVNFMGQMRKVTSAAPEYAGPTRKVFDLSDKIQRPEFYIARHELRKEKK